MTFVLGTIALGVAVGYLAGGRVGRLTELRLRWPVLALGGLLLQLVPTPSDRPSLALWLLLASFVMLSVFALANIRTGGVPLILLGVVLNATVIAVNHGMPVTRGALVASGQASTLEQLVEGGGARHHLAGPGDVLTPLSDAIPVPRPISQAISVGDVANSAGVLWLIVAGMRAGASTPEEIPQPQSRSGDTKTTEGGRRRPRKALSIPEAR